MPAQTVQDAALLSKIAAIAKSLILTSHRRLLLHSFVCEFVFLVCHQQVFLQTMSDSSFKDMSRHGPTHGPGATNKRCWLTLFASPGRPQH